MQVRWKSASAAAVPDGLLWITEQCKQQQLVTDMLPLPWSLWSGWTGSVNWMPSLLLTWQHLTDNTTSCSSVTTVLREVLSAVYLYGCCLIILDIWVTLCSLFSCPIMTIWLWHDFCLPSTGLASSRVWWVGALSALQAFWIFGGSLGPLFYFYHLHTSKIVYSFASFLKWSWKLF